MGVASTLSGLVRRLAPAGSLPEVEIYGRHSRPWMKALHHSAPLWTELKHRGCAQPAGLFRSPHRKRILVPLMEAHTLDLPGDCYALVPDRTSIAMLGDKAMFRRHAAALGLAHVLPDAIDLERPTFPAVLKRTNLNAAHGIALVTSHDDLAARLAQFPWLGKPVILEEHIDALTDYVTHLVCNNGRVVWHCSYSYPLAASTVMRGPVAALSLARHEASAADIAAFERLLSPLSYDGPANVDYRRRADGSLAIFEINPRLGGSLMRPENVDDLAGAFDAIVRYAKPHVTETERLPIGALATA